MIPRLRPAPVALVILSAFTCLLNSQTPSPDQAKPPAPPPARKAFGGAGGDYKEYPQETLDSGKKIYTANCAFCHGGNAKGGESGPDLLRSVIVLHDEDGVGIGAFIHVGRPEKGMPKFNLPDDQVKDLSAFLHDRVRAAAERGTYQILNIVVGDPKAGEAYFNGAGKCATCHSIDKDLAHIGTKYDPVTLQQKVVMPRDFGRRSAASSTTTAITAKVTQPDGHVVEGFVRHIDDFSITISDKNGDAKTFPRESPDVPKVELHDPIKPHTDLLSQYTDADIHNLTAYLVTIK